MSKPSIILMGSKPASVVALETAVRRGWNVVGVVISKQEPHPWLPGKRLGEAASELGIPVFIQSTIPAELKADLVVSYMYRHRVTARTLAMAELAALNFHAAPLPEYGGWAFYSVAILEGATEYGCTCHHMDLGFDSGPLCVVRRFPINAAEETAVSLERRAQREMIDLFLDILSRVERGEVLPKQQQDAARMRYLDRDSFMTLKEIPSGASEEEIDRRARAFFYPPYEGAFIRLGDAKVEVLPGLAKPELATLLHQADYGDLERVAARHVESKARNG